MTTVDERIFNLDQPNYVSYNRRKQDYLKIAPTTGTADNLNRTGIISYEVNNQANYLYLPESFLYCEFNLSNQAGTEVPGNITLEHNWFPRIFSEMRLEIRSQQLEIINEPGEFDTIFKFITRKRDYALANIEGWIPDTGSGNTVAVLNEVPNEADEAAVRTAVQRLRGRANVHNLNTGYLKRKDVYNNPNGTANRTGFWIKWPLSPLFGYLDHDKVSVNLPLKLQLRRRENDTGIFFGTGGSDAKLEIRKLELWIPNIQPSLDIEAALTKRLNTNKDIKVNFLKRNTFTTTVINQVHSWQIANVTNVPRFLFVAFKPTGLNSAFDVNNSLFTGYQAAGEGVGSTVKITDLQVKLNQARYPLDPMIQDPEHFNVFESYNAYSEICKVFGNNPQLNPMDFRNLYPIYCFDLSAQDENLIKNGIQIQLEIKKSSSESLTAYCLILEDTSHVIKVINGQMTRIE